MPLILSLSSVQSSLSLSLSLSRCNIKPHRESVLNLGLKELEPSN